MLNILIILCFLAVITYLGYLGYARTSNADDYLVAGRDIHPYVMAISYGATFISTSAIIGFGGAASMFGMGIFWLTFLNIFVGVLIAFAWFGARTRTMGHTLDAHTFPEFLSRRFDSKFIQVFAGLVIFIFMPLYASVVMMGASNFIQTHFGISYELSLSIFAFIIALYVILGGLKGVMFTDAFQGTIMFLGMLFLLIFTYAKLGGLTEAHQTLASIEPPQSLVSKGHQGWTSMPALGSNFWWTLVSTIILGVGIGVLAQPQLVVRFMTVKSDRELNRAIMVGGVFLLITVGVAYIVGALSNAYFLEHPDFQTITIKAVKGKIGKVIPTYIKTALPNWFSLVFLLTLLSAAMSTLSSQFHAMGTSIGRDVFHKLSSKHKGDPSVFYITKGGIVLAISLAVFIAWALPTFFPEQGTAIIARGTALFFGVCAATFLPAFISAIYWKGATKKGVVASMLTGLSVSVFWLLFIHAKEAKAFGLSQLLFNKPYLIQSHPFPVMDPVVVALPISAIVLIIVSLFTERYREKHLHKCFSNID